LNGVATLEYRTSTGDAAAAAAARRRQVARQQVALPLVEAPDRGEQHLEHGHDGAAEAQRRIAPDREARTSVDVLLGHVHAAGIHGPAVDQGDLHVVAVVDLGEPLVARLDLGARRSQPLEPVLGVGKAGKPVVEDTHLHPMGEPVEKDVGDPGR
jgi:hypothetical protein